MLEKIKTFLFVLSIILLYLAPLAMAFLLMTLERP